MDQETLSNHIAGLGKTLFDNACKIVLRDIFHLNAINVDGKNDGGTDFASFTANGERKSVAYQITTQKSDIKKKSYKDAAKSINKLGSKRFYFFTTFFLSETEVRKLENEISNELDIAATCLSSNQIAGLILNENLLNRFLDESNYPLPRDYSSQSFDYREMALHSYTLISDDAMDMKDGIYDDSLLFVLSNNEPLYEIELVKKVKEFLGLNDSKDEPLKKRIGALFGKNKLKRLSNDKIELTNNAKVDILGRKKVYESELQNLTAAQVDLMRNDYNSDWSTEDSKKIAIWIAESAISDQISTLKDAKASIVSNPIFKIEGNGVSKIKKYLKDEKKITKDKIDGVVEKLLKLASNHPLITKISRATIYVALEGVNPVSSAKALGANRWSDFNIMIEPTVAIPYACSQLYEGHVNRYFDLSIRAIQRAKKLGARLYIPYFYINECAGHLLQARKYQDLALNEKELQFSSNAFVANYYALKDQNIKLPPTLIDYLCSFSSAVKSERKDTKEWIRAIMTDFQSNLSKFNVEFVGVPFYQQGDCVAFELEYMHQIRKYELNKPVHLINHDVWALQFTNDQINKMGSHWIILTYDRSLIGVSRTGQYSGWITNPMKFLDLTESARPLSEVQLFSLVHSVATYSEKTLSAGARIIDRIIKYASSEIQNWEFKNEIVRFKHELVNSLNFDSDDFTQEVDKKIDDFLKSKGIDLKISEEDQVDS